MNLRCTYHMCLMKELFETLKMKEGGLVLLGNNKAYKVQNMGYIRLKVFNNQEILLQEVRYIPELKRNLFVNQYV